MSESEYDGEAEEDDDEDDDEEDDNEEEMEKDTSDVTESSKKGKRRTIPGPVISSSQPTLPPPAPAEETPTAEKKKKGAANKRKKTTAKTSEASNQTKKKNARPPMSQFSVIDNSEDDEDITEIANEGESEDPDETTAEKKRRLAASRLKVSICTLKKHHCFCCEFDGCCGCGKRMNVTQINREEDWQCTVRADRHCSFSDNYRHVCSECSDEMPNPSVSSPHSSQDDCDIPHCPFLFIGGHCSCESECCGCMSVDRQNQQCQGNGARLCEFSSYFNHNCKDCYDHCSDEELVLMIEQY